MAEACGAKWHEDVLSFGFTLKRFYGPHRWELPDGRVIASDIPDYPKDRDAILSAIRQHEDHWEVFIAHLCLLASVSSFTLTRRDAWSLLTADNATLIEALLRALGKWSEEEITHTCEFHDGVSYPDGESCPQCDAAEAKARAEHLPGYLAAKAQGPAAMLLAQGGKIVVGEMIDDLKGGKRWGICECTVEMPDGRVIEGTVQGSDHEFEASTLEVDA